MAHRREGHARAAGAGLREDADGRTGEVRGADRRPRRARRVEPEVLRGRARARREVSLPTPSVRTDEEAELNASAISENRYSVEKYWRTFQGVKAKKTQTDRREILG